MKNGYAIKIAWRYLFARKSHAAVNVISMVSMVGVALAVTAMVVVMSVFNGFARFTEEKVGALEADLTIVADNGKAIAEADSLAAVISGVDGVGGVGVMIEEKGFAVYADMQTPVTLRGIGGDTEFGDALSSMTIDGYGHVGRSGDINVAMLSVGASNALRCAPGASMPVLIYEPRRVGRINAANPARAFRVDSVYVAGVFRSDIDDVDADMVVVDIDVARRLLDYDTDATMIVVRAEAGVDARSLGATLKELLGADYKVLTPVERQAEAFKMINVEKWVTLLMLTFVLVIATFNILSTMGMLMVEKRRSMRVMRAIGATAREVGHVFGALGAMVGITGAIVGMIAGVALTMLQSCFGFIKMSVDDPGALAIESYPVELRAVDLLAIAGVVTAIALLTAAIEAYVARRMAR